MAKASGIELAKCFAPIYEEEGKIRVRAMNEIEALIQRRELLIERISKMDYEVQKIDHRIAYLDGKGAERINAFQSQKRLMNEVSI